MKKLYDAPMLWSNSMSADDVLVASWVQSSSLVTGESDGGVFDDIFG